MKIGDLVTFCPEAWGTPLEDRPLGVVMNVEDYRDGIEPEHFLMVTAIFPGDDIPYSSKIEDFEIVNENW
tara:strand:+ start:58 stop:267 length:210 start_codon:yes stop_codon:yes gene_type:complete